MSSRLQYLILFVLTLIIITLLFILLALARISGYVTL